MRRESEERARQVPSMRRTARRAAGRSGSGAEVDSMEDGGPYHRMRRGRWCRGDPDRPIDAVIVVNQFCISRHLARIESTVASDAGFDGQGRWT